MKTVIYNDHYYDIFLFFIPKKRASFLSLRSVGWYHDLIYSLVHQTIYLIVNNSGCLMTAKLQNDNWGTSLVIPWLRFCTFNAGGPGLIPGWGIRSHMLQIKVRMRQGRLKILCYNQDLVPVNKQKQIFFKKRMKLKSRFPHSCKFSFLT